MRRYRMRTILQSCGNLGDRVVHDLSLLLSPRMVEPMTLLDVEYSAGSTCWRMPCAIFPGDLAYADSTPSP